MGIDVSVFHSYGLLFSEESVEIILSRKLPVWKIHNQQLYETFSKPDIYIEFGEYLSNHYEVNIYGNIEYQRGYRISDGADFEEAINDHFYFYDLKHNPSFFRATYSSFEDIITEIKEHLGDIIPDDFPYKDYVIEIYGESW